METKFRDGVVLGFEKLGQPAVPPKILLQYGRADTGTLGQFCFSPKFVILWAVVVKLGEPEKFA
jgi:hypothetical protein